MANNEYTLAADKNLNEIDIAKQQSNNIIISIQDNSPLHVHPQGTPFRIRVQITAPKSAKISYQWFDSQANPLSDPVWLQSKRRIDIQSPDSKAGYYGLVFSTQDSHLKFLDRQVGEKREYGFVIKQSTVETERSIDPDSPFGIVHAKLDDPALPGWIKTLTWKTYSARHWKNQIQKREKLGLIELPMLVDYEWVTDDTKVVSADQLTALGSRVQDYFETEPNVIYWELGREENLKKRFSAKYYWSNLNKKIETIRTVANKINPEIKFIYQIAGLNLKSISKYAKNSAAKNFDVLSLHPYAWPNFIAPEQWLEEYLISARRIMTDNGLGDQPIWFTEIGVPHQGNYKGGFFGYPKLGREVSGHSPAQVASYMLKLHILAFSMDVKKLFWYNYKDRRLGREQVENHFGLVDYWGYPKPAYAAYLTLLDRVNGKRFAKTRQLSSKVRLFEFKDSDEILWITWCYPDCNQDIALSSIIGEKNDNQHIEIINSMGTPLTNDKKMIRIKGQPIFITVRSGKPAVNFSGEF